MSAMGWVFLDVGAHVGQTLQEVCSRRYCFERIYSFEPMPVQFDALRRQFGGRPGLTLINAGLAAFTGEAPIYGSNEDMGATMFSAKNHFANREHSTGCRFIRASEFIDSLPSDARIIMKLNCEGAECVIVNELIDTGRIQRLDNIMIDFDVRKIAGMEADETVLRERLASIGFDRWCDARDAMVGRRHAQRIHNWLRGLPFAAEYMRPSILRRALAAIS